MSGYRGRMLALSLALGLGSLLWLATGAVGVGAPAPGIQLPALMDPPSTETHPGKVIWADLVTPNLDRAQQFYGELFGWTFQPVPGDPHFVLALLDGRPVAGLLQRSMPSAHRRQPAWLTFLAVRDVEAAQRSVQAQGGKLLSSARSYPQRGRQAVFADPDGAIFAVLASSSGDPPDLLAQPGEWIWSSVLATRADREADFYRALFGYERFDLPSDDGSSHVILGSDDYARAGISTLPNDQRRRHPHWLNFVRVEDAAAAAEKAVALGGRILVEPRIDRQGGQVAVIADPDGAPVGLMEWSDSGDTASDSAQEPQIPQEPQAPEGPQ